MENLFVNQTEYKIIKLLGKGKGGYSYLAEKGDELFVLKQIHHEPCDYYTFGNKIESEQRDYQRLVSAGITVPRMIDIDIESERIVKEYIEGSTVFELVRDGLLDESCFDLIRKEAEKAKSAGLNIDYFPTNFIPKDGVLYYIDYECNEYMEQWDFEHWGIKYWSKTPEFTEYLEKH